jgi:hypothetical protein
MLDVLGFRKIIEQRGFDWVSEKYRALEHEVSSLSKWEVRSKFFSDSLLVFSVHPIRIGPILTQLVEMGSSSQPRASSETGSGDGQQEPLDGLALLEPPPPAAPPMDDLLRLQSAGDVFLNYTAAFAARAFRLGLPLRGGLALGMTDFLPSRDIYLGQALIDAYTTESRQDWPGISFHEGCYKWTDGPWAMPSVRNTPSIWMRSCKWNVPIKSGPPIDWTLNWMQGVGKMLGAQVEANMDTPFERRWLALQEYFDHMRSDPPKGAIGPVSRHFDNDGRPIAYFGPRFDVD